MAIICYNIIRLKRFKRQEAKEGDVGDELLKIKEDIIQGLGRFSAFAGFNKITGQIYGLLYLNREPLALGQIAEQLDVSKGNVSLNVRIMERWGLIRRFNKRGDRRDYYEAETDFWKVIRGILTERDKKEVEYTMDSVTDGLAAIGKLDAAAQTDEAVFYKERLEHMQEFGDTIAEMSRAFLALDNFRVSSLSRLGLGRV
jgi:DNA-binding transcriptional regulator GbsR (MarR family)